MAARRSEARTPRHVPLVIETDIGTDVDDAIALLLAAVLPRVEIVAVTTVSGHPDVRGRLARRLLGLAGCGDVPVLPGCRAPLDSRRFARMLPGDGLWLGHEGRGVLDTDELTPIDAPPAQPMDSLTELIAGVGEPVQLLSIGPSANLALALSHTPDLREHIGTLIAMGGVVNGPARLGGHALPPVCEFNFNADREAIARLLESDLPTIVVPAEVSYQAAWSEREMAVLREARHPALRALSALLEIWAPIYRRLLEQLGVARDVAAGVACHLHDPLALMVALTPDRFEFEDIRIDLVEQDGQLITRRSAHGAHSVTVLIDGDMGAFAKETLAMLLELDNTALAARC